VLRRYRDYYNHERYHQGIKRIPMPAEDIERAEKDAVRAGWFPDRS
jgi:hypothetical protein